MECSILFVEFGVYMKEQINVLSHDCVRLYTFVNCVSVHARLLIERVVAGVGGGGRLMSP